MVAVSWQTLSVTCGFTAVWPEVISLLRLRSSTSSSVLVQGRLDDLAVQLVEQDMWAGICPSCSG